jgi:hypothetical protein
VASDHCMHTDHNGSPAQRRCCWCAMVQHKVFDRGADHGPYMPDQDREFHWEPKSTVACPNRVPLAGTVTRA